MRPREHLQLTETLTLQNIGLAENTLNILNHKFFLPRDLQKVTSKEVTVIVSHFANILFPEDEDKELPGVYNGLIHTCLHDLTDLSYFVTTAEGKPFLAEYKYLHNLVTLLYAHAGKCSRGLGNIFMIGSGKRFLRQYPNEFHLQFVNKLIALPRGEDEYNWDVSVAGGALSQSFVTEGKDYLVCLTEVPEALSESGVAVAQFFAQNFGIANMTGLFLRDISPREVRDQREEPERRIAQTYLQRRSEVRKYLENTGKRVGHPSFIIEYLMAFFESGELYTYESDHILEFIAALRVSAGDQYYEYQSLLLARVAELLGQKQHVPDVIVDELERQPRNLSYT